MPRKIGKNVAKKSRGRSRSRIRNQKVSRSLRRNSRRNSVVKRKNKSRRKQRGRGNNAGGHITNSDNRPECKDDEVKQATDGHYNITSEFGDKSKAQEPKCLLTHTQCKEQIGNHLRDTLNHMSPFGAPCVSSKNKKQICGIIHHATWNSQETTYGCKEKEN